MILTLFRAYGVWLLISSFVCLTGVLSALATGPDLARDFFVSFVYRWNGLVVAMTGFGALHFALSTFRQQFNYLVSQILHMGEAQATEVSFELEKLFSFSNKQAIAIPVFVVGATTLYVCGYPLHGFPQFILWFSSSFMFYAGGLMLAYTLYSIRVFSCLERNGDRITLQNNAHIFELENFNLYLSMLFLVAMVALYFAFRGTLTANFTFVPPNEWIGSLAGVFLPPGQPYSSVRNLLVFPIVAFLPLALFSGFYMRLVLRKIYLGSIKQKVLEIDDLARPLLENAKSPLPADRILEIRKAAMDLKDAIIQNNKVLPLIDVKDAPSIVLLMVIVIQFIFNNDTAVREFFGALLGFRAQSMP